MFFHFKLKNNLRPKIHIRNFVVFKLLSSLYFKSWETFYLISKHSEFIWINVVACAPVHIYLFNSVDSEWARRNKWKENLFSIKSVDKFNRLKLQNNSICRRNLKKKSTNWKLSPSEEENNKRAVSETCFFPQITLKKFGNLKLFRNPISLQEKSGSLTCVCTFSSFNILEDVSALFEIFPIYLRLKFKILRNKTHFRLSAQRQKLQQIVQ